jgi:hypothetical protein
MMMKDPILLLKTPMGTRKNFSENNRKFGHALSKRFASPALHHEHFLCCVTLPVHV